MSNWSRAQLKDRAKNVLRHNYWIAFVVALILAFATGSGGIRSETNYSTSFNTTQFDEFKTEYNGIIDTNDFSGFKELYRNNNFPGKYIFASVITVAVLIAILFSIAVKVFLFNPLAVGCYKFYSSSAESAHNNMAPVGIAFKKGNYGGIVKGMFLMNLFTFLWTLLFIIPGIIKTYAYRMVPYIMADNPEMNATDAITLSRNMMDGEKFDAFVLDLSFIGWYLLGILACGIGVLFVNPYKFSTDAQLYLVIRDKAIDNSLCTPEMLNLATNG